MRQTSTLLLPNARNTPSLTEYLRIAPPHCSNPSKYSCSISLWSFAAMVKLTGALLLVSLLVASSACASRTLQGDGNNHHKHSHKPSYQPTHRLSHNSSRNDNDDDGSASTSAAASAAAGGASAAGAASAGSSSAAAAAAAAGAFCLFFIRIVCIARRV